MNRTGRLASLAFAAIVLALAGCDDFVLRTLMEGERGSAWAGPLRISPSTVTVLQGSVTTFSASGGGGGYTYSLVTSLGGSVAASTGAYTAPAASGTEIVRVRDSVGATAEATVTVTGGAPDYRVQSATFPGPGTGNTGFAGSFVIENISPDAGTVAPTWRVYRSSDASIDPGDTIAAAGTSVALAGLTAGASIPFAGTWPSAGGPWFLIVEIAATDDATSANNLNASGSIVVTDVPPADVDYTVMAVNNAGGTTAGGALAGTFTFRNVATDNGAQGVQWTACLSADAVWDAGDTVVDADATTPLNAGVTSAAIPFAGTWPAAPGTWYLIVKVSAADDVAAGNDTGASGALASTAAPVDYDVLTVTNTGGTTAGAAMAGEFQFRNIGTAGGAQTVHWTAYVSSDTTLDGADPVVDADTATALGAGATSAFIPFAGTWPTVSGTWYLIVTVSAGDDIAPANDEQSSGAVVLTGPPAANVDYDVTSVTNTGGTVGGGTIAAQFVAQNIGTTAGTQSVTWTAYVSADAALGGGDTVVGTGTFGPLAASASTGAVVFGGAWPLTGPRYLIVQLAASDDIAAPNNVQASAQVVLSAAPVDYMLTSVSNTGGTTAGAALAGQFTMQNAGAAAGTRTVYWEAYVSTDATLDGGDALIDSGSNPWLGASASAGPIAFAGTWPTTPGSYFLLVLLTAEDETDTSDNTGATAGAVATTSPNINYQVNSVVHVGPAYTAATLQGQAQVENIGTVNGTATLYWTAYRSLNNTLEIGTDIVVDAGTSAALNASATTLINFADTWPGSPGTWYLILRVSASDDPAAGNDTLTSLSVSLTYPPIDYQVNAVNNVGSTFTGAALQGQFQLQNIGTQNGSAGVSWTAYRSLDNLLQIGTDIVVDAGMTSGLNASASTVVPFSDTWPSTPGAWYLIVEVSSADDNAAGNNRQVSVNVPITNPPVDYRVLSVTNTGGTFTGQALGGEFQLQNAGTSAGTKTVYWTAYRSLNDTLEIGTDIVVDSGTWPVLAGGASQLITFDGTWPLAAGTWYLIVRAEAADDVTAGNETFASVAIPIAPPPGPDYAVPRAGFNATVSWSGLIGSAVDGAPQFTIQNMAANAGSSTIYWYVYRSTDQVLDGTDVVLAQGNTGPLGAGGSTVIPYGGTWTAGMAGGFYHLILRVAAADDTSPINDMAVSHPIGVGSSRYQEVGDAANGTGPNPALPQTTATGLTLLPNETLVIEGVGMDAYNSNDTYRWTAGVGANGMFAAAKWETGYDDIDLFFWTTTAGVEFVSQGYTTDGEPGGDAGLEITGLTSGATYFLSTWFYLYGDTSGSAGQPYVMIVKGLP